MARRPLDGTVAANVQRWGTGALAIDACRIETADNLNGGAYYGAKRAASSAVGIVGRGVGKYEQPIGRWPANVALDEDAAALLDAQSGNRPGMSGGGKHRPGAKGGMFGAIDCVHTARGDQGGASRFFYTAKVSAKERGEGNRHPTLKPIALTTWLARLILPPTADARLLVPFAGAGSEMIGATHAGWPSVVGIELSEEYAAIARRRLE